MLSMPSDSAQTSDSDFVAYEVVYQSQNRFRFRIPQLIASSYCECLQGLVQSLVFVTQTRINPAARSLIVEYDAAAIAQDRAASAIEECIQSAGQLSSVPSSAEPVEEDFSIATPTVGYQIVHRNEYRLRICIPRLGDDPEYLQKLKQLTTALDHVKEVWINRGARSLAIEYTRPLSGSNLEAILLQTIQRAANLDLDQVQILTQPPSPPEITPEQAHVEYWERLGLPALGLVLGLGALVGVPIPGLVTAGVILTAARPLFQRAWDSLRDEQQLTIDFLDGLALSLHTMQGSFFAPALMLGLIEGGELIRDQTARGSARASYDLLDCLGLDALVERQGQEISIPVKEIELSDRVLVYPGDQIPVDGRIVRGAGLIDQCKLTGESIPVERAIGDEVFASTLLMDGYLCIAVERTGKQTRAGVIAELMQSAPVHDTRVENYAAMIANQLVVPTLVTAAAVGLINGDLNRTISLLTLDLGTGIRISVPTTIMSALTYAARHGVFIRSGRALEILAKVDTIVFDKTGTLTRGQAGITQVELVVGMGADSGAAITERELLSLAATAEQGLTHPVAEAITRHARTLDIPLGTCDTWDYRVGLGVVATIDGRSLLVGSHRLMAQEGVSLAGLQSQSASGSQSVIYVARDGQLLGVICYRDPLRSESQVVIQTLQELGIESYMLSGDMKRVAAAVASELGMNPDHVYAEAFPEQKVQVVQALHASGKQVAFCGDGINDSAALAYADVSISFAGATDIARETADIVLMENDLQSLVQAIYIARQAMEIIQQNILIVGIPNLSAICTGVLFALNPVLAILINNGSAILAELNALRPLLGPSIAEPMLEPSRAQSYERLTEFDPEFDLEEIVLPVSVAVHASSDRGFDAVAPDPVVLDSVIRAPSLFDDTPVHAHSNALTLRQSELAQRLGVSHQVLSRRRLKPEFFTWSQIHDPEARGWRYDAIAKRFEMIEKMDARIAIGESDRSSFQPADIGKTIPANDLELASAP